jgi:ribose 5-phosphate isomerase A
MVSDFANLAERALAFVHDGCCVGLGSGRTASAFVRALAERVRHGLRVRGVPTSEATAHLARSLGVPLATLDDADPLEVTLDGADEVQRGTLHALKGWGGALVRERIVAAASRRQILLVAAEKVVARLGERGKLPVEVLPFAAPFVRRRLERLPVPGGLRPVLREHNGRVLLTDNGNWIFDCALQPQDDPAALDRALRAVPGVVDTGLFLGTAAVVLVAEGGTVQEWRRPGASGAGS